MSIEVEGLAKKYGDQWAVDHVSFDVPAGQVVGFLGPNGAGKSTTMKMLTGYISPTQGSAKVCGISVTDDSLSVRKQVGYLPESNPLYYDMYVKEYLRFVAGLYDLDKQTKSRVSEMIELTGLQLEQHKKIGALSKGYKQRVGMAQALMNNPKVLILDEPTSGLDPNQITEIRKLITNIGRERTVMLSTHIMQEVEAMCSRVLIINRGRLVADDSISNLQRQHGNKQSLQVKFKNGVDISHINAIEGIIEVDDLGGYRYRIDAKTDLNLQEKLFNFAVETSNVLLEQKEVEQSLESVFKSLTRNG